jgi:chromate transporter
VAPQGRRPPRQWRKSALTLSRPRASDAAPFSGGFEGAAVVIGLGGFVALFRYRLDVTGVIAACAAAGLLYLLFA